MARPGGPLDSWPGLYSAPGRARPPSNLWGKARRDAKVLHGSRETGLLMALWPWGISGTGSQLPGSWGSGRMTTWVLNPLGPGGVLAGVSTCLGSVSYEAPSSLLGGTTAQGPTPTPTQAGSRGSQVSASDRASHQPSPSPASGGGTWAGIMILMSGEKTEAQRCHQ